MIIETIKNNQLTKIGIASIKILAVFLSILTR